MRPPGSPAELERRRLRAIDLLQRDIHVHVVAERLGVDRRSVRRWKRAHRGQGRAGLRARPAAGRPPKLTGTQRRQLVRMVVAGPKAAGYRTSRWTCRRLVDLIRHSFKVVYGALLRREGLYSSHQTTRRAAFGLSPGPSLTPRVLSVLSVTRAPHPVAHETASPARTETASQPPSQLR